ncbi:MAG: flavin reductase family protein [candidate division Zixibacteria bacterium]|nr:flavin reductase family protein [candidate division Zixibacteria bacterium]
MAKVNVGPNAFGYPMPMSLVGTMVEGRPNFMAAAWVSRVNPSPPMMAVAIGKSHATNTGIKQQGSFSINFPGVDLIKATDYCGLVSGKKTDKSKVFEVYYGQLETAPLIAACPFGLECRLIDTVELPIDDLFIGEIVAAYTEEKYMTEGSLDVRLMKPFLLTMPDNRYWAVGEVVGKAWQDGRDLRG